MSDRFHPNYEVSVCTETAQEYSTFRGMKPTSGNLIITLCVSLRFCNYTCFNEDVASLYI